MSAPNTNVEKQSRRHAGPIIGMAAGLAFVAIILVGYFFWVASPSTEEADTIDGNDAQIVDPQTVGDEPTVDPTAPVSTETVDGN
ncbi:hypothetical protein [uncultured Jannaschia sp.]|uniref:hypothetical protein n=1 Tax=uncultured Jannaschia sp. TaxID=293347 RepID=UPI00263737A8|nr:hypothetical protein [uncultured Jannaschia sp.]